MDKDKERKIISTYVWSGLIYMAICIAIVLLFEELLIEHWRISVNFFLICSFAIWSIVTWAMTFYMFKALSFYWGWWFTSIGILFTGGAVIYGLPHFYGHGVPSYSALILIFVSILPIEIYRRKVKNIDN